jgi:hypothetical protein
MALLELSLSEDRRPSIIMCINAKSRRSMT